MNAKLLMTAALGVACFAAGLGFVHRETGGELPQQ